MGGELNSGVIERQVYMLFNLHSGKFREFCIREFLVDRPIKRWVDYDDTITIE